MNIVDKPIYDEDGNPLDVTNLMYNDVQKVDGYLSTHFGCSIKKVFIGINGSLRISCVENSNRNPMKVRISFVESGYSLDVKEKYIDTISYALITSKPLTKHVLVSDVAA